MRVLVTTITSSSYANWFRSDGMYTAIARSAGAHQAHQVLVGSALLAADECEGMVTNNARLTSTSLGSAIFRAYANPECRDHCARRPRQNDARRQDAASGRRIPGESGGGRSCHGFQPARTGAGHYDSG